MTTFSQLVDQVANESKRLDLVSEFRSYLNQSIRECHFEPTRGNVVYLRSNYREAALVADAEERFSWSIPNLAVWQGISAVRYDNVFDTDGRQIYADEVVAGRASERFDYAYQVAGDRVVFKGYGGLNAAISVAYFEYPPSLKYFAAADRPATWDDVDGWTYHVDYDIDDDSRETARILVSNWLLMRWDSILEEGLRAKLYKRLSDTERARTSYSLFAQLRQGLITSEQAQLGGSW